MELQNFKISIPKQAITELPIVQYDGKIELLETEEDAKKAIGRIMNCRVIGFDTETKPSFKKGHPNHVALIQISTGDVCYLFRINKIGFIKELREIFSTDSIRKIGLSTHDDIRMLGQVHEFEVNSLIDLQNMVKEYRIKDCALQRIFAILFGRRISKAQRLSNWEAETLTDAQQTYAAIDAWANLKIYNHLKSGKFVPENSPYKVVETDEGTTVSVKTAKSDN